MITFRQLELTHFRGIDSAKVEFSPGLNIFYGPNELGKSSLLIAIRAALLLPVTSSEARDLKTWGSSSVPTVTLHFCVNDVEYRVYKPFATGTRSSALLDRINGADRFNIARGAKVDNELRTLIEWGIPEPGRGAPRGLPQSYLSNALLGMQDEVEKVLRTDLGEDKSDSGLHTLTKALGTIGIDPLTSDLLDTLESRTSKVFTPTGQIKRTGDSPLNQLTLETNMATRVLEDLQRDLRESQGIEASMEGLRSKAIQNEDQQRRLEKVVELTQKARAAEEDLQQFQNKEKDIQSARNSYKEHETALQKLQTEFDNARTTTKQIEKELSTANSKLTAVEEKLKSIDEISASQVAAQRSELRAEIASMEDELKRAQTARATENEVTQLTAERNRANNKLNAFKQSLSTAEQQLHYSNLLNQKQGFENTIESLQQARTTRNAAESEVNRLQEESNRLGQLNEQTNQLLGLRRSLDNIHSTESELTQARAMRDEAQHQFDQAHHALQQNNAVTNVLREKVQHLQQKLAATQGRQQSHSETAHTATQSRQLLLQKNIESAKQRISNAEAALELQQRISETERYIDQLNRELTAGKRNLDRATSDVRRRNPREARTHRGGNHRQRTPENRSKPIFGIALTVIATLGCLASWFVDFFSAGLIAAPMVAGLGLVATFLTQRGNQQGRRGYRKQRREPSFESEYQSDHERLGRSADELRRGSDRLAAAEDDLRHLRQRYSELRRYLNAEPYDVVEQENAKIQQAEYDLNHLDQHHNEEIRTLQQQMLDLEQETNQQNEQLDSLIADHARLQKDQQAAQSNLLSFEAKIEHLVKGSHVQGQNQNAAEAEAELRALADGIQSTTDLKLDHSTDESIQQFRQTLDKNSKDHEQQLTFALEKLAASKAEVQTIEQNSPEARLADIQTAIAEFESQHTSDGLSRSASLEESQQAIDLARANIETEKSNLANIEGQISAKQNSLPVQSTTLPAERLTELETKLVIKQTALKEINTDTVGQREQLEIESSKLVENSSVINTRLAQEKQKLQQLEDSLTVAKEAFGKAQGILQELEAARSRIDVESAQATIDAAIAQSDGHIHRNGPMAEQLTLLKQKLESAKTQTVDSQKELNQHRGKLDKIGGAVLEDRVRRQEETCNRLNNEAHELQKESEAEKYLQEVLAEEDEKHTDHLGRVLAKPVSTKFDELTGNRYGAFTLDPQLTAQTIKAEGDSREYEQLSIGTRQQLAVLVKLALAAQLRSAVVLDDQLVHSDPERQQWFREALQASVRDFEHQIIVLTCRPDDYRSNDANTVNLAGCLARVTSAA